KEPPFTYRPGDDLDDYFISSGRRQEIVVEVVTGPVGKGRFLRIPLTGMAQRAIVHLAISRKAGGIENVFSGGVRRVGCLIPDVRPRVPVAFFAGQAERVRTGVAYRAAIHSQGERRAVAFQAARYDEPSEIDLTVRVAG